MATAYDRTLCTVGIVDRNDPLAEIIARKVIEITQTGVRDPAVIAARAIKELGM